MKCKYSEFMQKHSCDL